MIRTQTRVFLAFPSGEDREYQVGDAGLTLGRAPTCDVTFADPTVSRTHARIEPDAGGFVIVDLGSSRGTRVNGAPVGRASLSSGDAVGLGDAIFVFHLRGGAVDSSESSGAVDAGATMLEAPPPDPQPAPAASVVVRIGQKTWEVPLGHDPVTIGRTPGSSIHLDDAGVSRRHALVELEGNEFVIRDLHSTNGTWIGLRRIDEHTLDDGDSVRIGSARLAFKRNLSPAELNAFKSSQPDAAVAAIDIEIDAAKCKEQVEEIASSDFFRDLAARARRLRTAGAHGGGASVA